MSSTRREGRRLYPLDHSHRRLLLQRPYDAGRIRPAGGIQRDLPIPHAEFPQRSRSGRLFADHALERVIWGAGGGKQSIARAQYAEQGDGDGVGAGDDAVPHQGVGGAHSVGKHPVEHLPAPVPIPVPGGRGKMGFTHPVGDKRAEDFALVLFRNRFDAGKRRSRAGHGFPGETFQPGIDRKNIG